MSITRFPLLFSDKDYLTFPFYKNGLPLKNAPLCGMSIKKAGSMRFRWNERNPGREDFLKKLSQKGNVKPVSLELIHSKIVYDLKNGDETSGQQGDGMITCRSDLLPVVTVADCMPIFLYEPETGLFGVVHSGWKGTGIIKEAVELACKNYGAKTENFYILLGPHIRDCCYIVNQERADYFSKEFSPDCLSPLEEGGVCLAGGRGLPVSWKNGGGQLYRLSLEKANLSVLKAVGIRDENIAVCSDCTCCNEKLGSNRRETADYNMTHPAANADQLSRCFTVQAAFCGYNI
ncbi:hypothetical protein MSI_03500 [Treponema sp. JC4]|uniref:polyphenol oxidase family protein n=1 Tax=Treponema sp. JC4 TaxID=1124982 RepID=UPI00025B09F7|nr:polyphenol oxidase family protein [Treponema sp. JC4]EID85922.1 hypothetical protein MSI_03500 [Treponema sp. JC4]